MPHPGYQAALVADPAGPRQGAHVLDLSARPEFGDSLTWNEVAQSFMLFDSTGALWTIGGAGLLRWPVRPVPGTLALVDAHSESTGTLGAENRTVSSVRIPNPG